ncbi:proteasome-activating nucleotidase [Phaeosphaeriaceae sp. PMI808]|nr:proteasome-activating nucleotidase [Phaeosphaeriaceae sp. PMI808]
MAAPESIFAATSTARDYMTDKFSYHTSASRLDTRTRLLNHFRTGYRQFHVTEVDQRKVSLYEFAAAGKAELVEDPDDKHVQATRTWVPVGEGLEKKVHPGMLKDEPRFTRFQYIWNSNEYLVYYTTWHDPFKPADKIFYILHQRGASNITNNHCAETDALILSAGKWTSQLHQEIFVFDDGCWIKSRELYKSVYGASWADVILPAEMKKNLIEDVQGFFDNKRLYDDFAVPWKRGVILHGVPGNGKTVSIKALMSALYARDDTIPSLYVKSFETKSSTEQHAIRSIFTMARNMAPCLLIFEDLDSLVHSDIRSYFLNEVDGLESNDGILMIGSTNHLDQLDPAISKRPSRFDRKYHFQLPGAQERKDYALYWGAKLERNGKVEITSEIAEIVAQLTEGFSFAYLKELWVTALLGLARGFKGEEFEIVDKEEAASADGDGNKKDEELTIGETCTCATKCKECDKLLPSAAGSAGQALEKEKEKEKDKKRMVLSDVEIPEHLVDNVLLKVIKHQIRILHAEMDNSNGEEKGGKINIEPVSKRMMMRTSRAC